MVKLTRTSIEKNEAVCTFDNLRKSSFPIYFRGLIVASLKINKKHDDADIMFYQKDIEGLDRESLKDIFDVAVEAMNKFNIGFNRIHQKGASRDSVNLPQLIENDYVAIKKSIDSPKINLISTETRNALIENNVQFLGYAGEPTLPYHTEKGNSEDIIGHYSPYSDDVNPEQMLEVFLKIKDGSDFSSNNILVDKDIWEENITLFGRENKENVIIPNNKYINDGVLSNRLCIYSRSLEVSMTNLVLDFSEVDYSFEEYESTPARLDKVWAKEFRTLKCNPNVYEECNFYHLDNDGLKFSSFGEIGACTKEEFLKHYEKNKIHDIAFNQ